MSYPNLKSHAVWALYLFYTGNEKKTDGGGAFIKIIMFNLCCTESNALFPANQRTESAQQPITAELALVSFVSALIFCLQTQFKPNFDAVSIGAKNMT